MIAGTTFRKIADNAEETTMTMLERMRGPVRHLLLPAMVALGLLTSPAAQAQQPKEIKIGLLVPLSGLYARPGAVMRMGGRTHQCGGRRQGFGRRQVETGGARLR